MIEISEVKQHIIPDKNNFPVLDWDNWNGYLRSPEMFKRYQNDLVQIKKDWVSVIDYILVKKFGYSELTTTRNAKFKKYAYSHKDSPKFILEPSDYPYDLIDHDFHYILWINSNDVEVIKKAIEKTKFDLAGTNYIYFQNQPYNQSVRMTHLHFIGNFKIKTNN